MIHSKEHYKTLSKDGYKWTGFWDKFHHFTKEVNNPRGYLTVACTDEDLTNGNFDFMIKHGLTRDIK